MKTNLTTTILLLFTHICFAQDFWVELEKPTGGTVFSLAVNSIAEVYAGMGNGVYLSNDDSNSWTLNGLEGITTYSLHIHQNGNIFAGTGGFNSLYRLVNYDEGWHPLLSGIGNVISIMHTNAGDLFIGNWGGIYKSTDFGETWEQILEAESAGWVVNAIIENSDGILFAGVIDFFGGGGVYHSLDNGDTWQHAGLNNKFISSLAVSSSGVLFAGSRGDYEYGGGGVYRSEDNGLTWEEIAYNVLVTSMAIDPNDVIYIGCTNEHGGQGGVFRSVDNGNTWELIVTGMGIYLDVRGLSLSPDGYLYAYHNKLHRSVEPVFEVVYSVSATANPFEGGEISGTGEYTHGQTATLTATANEGYAFVSWTDTLGVALSTDTVYSFTVIKNIELVANFELINSIQHHSFSDISIFPNPASDRLHIGIERPAIEHLHKTLFISDMQGRGILTQSFTGNSLNVSLESFSPGVYLVYIMTGQNVLRAGKVVVR